MLGCLLIAFQLCAPPNYYGPNQGYGYGYAYAQPQQQVVYAQPVAQPVYVVQPAPVYYAPQPVYAGPAISLNFGGWNRGYWRGGCGRRYC